MFVIDALKTAVKTAAKTDGDVHIRPGAATGFTRFSELDDIIESLRKVNDIAPVKIGSAGVRPIETIIKSIDDIYTVKFGSGMPTDVLNALRSGVRRAELEHMVGNRAFMDDRADSFTRIMAKVSENIDGYRDTLNKIHDHLRENLPTKIAGGGEATMKGSRYRIAVPMTAIAAGTGSYVFYKAFVKSVCENNVASGCIWTRAGEKCKIASATCALSYKHTDVKSMPPCPSSATVVSEHACDGWTPSDGKTICQMCNADAVAIKSGIVECVEAPTIGAIIMDAMDTGFGDINTAVSVLGSIASGFLKYAHYGFLIIVAIILSVLYSRLKSISSAVGGGYSEHDHHHSD